MAKRGDKMLAELAASMRAQRHAQTAAERLRTAGRVRQDEAVAIDVTPERLAKGDPHELVNPALIDSTEQPIGLTRRFRASHIDRLHRNGKLTWVQWYAGDVYRNRHHLARFGGPIISGYGEYAPGGEPCYGLPTTEAQLRHRQWVAAARSQWPMATRGFMERLLIHDDLPSYGGRKAMRSLAEIRTALDNLAHWLRLG